MWITPYIDRKIRAEGTGSLIGAALSDSRPGISDKKGPGR